MEWEASLPYEKEVKVKGNSMTQKYYVERLLPIYIDAMNYYKQMNPSQAYTYELQEDRDPSHGMKRKGLAQLLKEEHGA